MTDAGHERLVDIDAGEAGSRSAALLVRLWTEGPAGAAGAAGSGTPRARLLTLDGGESRRWATAVGEAAIAREVLGWVRSAVRADPLRAPAPAPRPREVPALVGADWVQEHLGDPAVVVVEAVDGPGSPGRAGLPGSVRLSPADLRHPLRRALPTAGALADLMDSRGVATGSHVVVVGATSAARAAAALWTLAVCGHRRTSLLDGDVRDWAAAGRPLAPPADRAPTTGYVPGPRRADLLLTRDQLLAGFVGAPSGTALLDCRSPSEFAGEPVGDPGPAGRARGHVPGAVGLPVEDLLEPGTQRLLQAPALEDAVRRCGVERADHVVVYCGENDRSPLVWFALHELLGWPDVRCYPGAWAEYGGLTDVPVERGPALGA